MTVDTADITVTPVQLERRVQVVIEHRHCPAVTGMAIATLVAELALMHVVVSVAVRAA